MISKDQIGGLNNCSLLNFWNWNRVKFEWTIADIHVLMGGDRNDTRANIQSFFKEEIQEIR